MNITIGDSVKHYFFLTFIHLPFYFPGYLGHTWILNKVGNIIMGWKCLQQHKGLAYFRNLKNVKDAAKLNRNKYRKFCVATILSDYPLLWLSATEMNCDMQWCLVVNNSLLQRVRSITCYFLSVFVITYLLIHLCTLIYRESWNWVIELPLFYMW